MRALGKPSRFVPPKRRFRDVSAAPNASTRTPAQHPAKRVAEGSAKLGSPLDRRLNFSTFVCGRANQLALSLARKLTEGRDAAMTPLFFHGSVGLGKTHLLQSIVHAAVGRRQSVVYLTAETFMYGFVNALRSQSAISFKESLRSIDLLVFDDAQFLQGRVIQNEFGHVLNSLIDAGRQVVIAADRTPSELDSIDERVRSRLAGGICVEMQTFDESLRLKILEMRLAVSQTDASHAGHSARSARFYCWGGDFQRARSRRRDQPFGGARAACRQADDGRGGGSGDS